MFGLLRNLSVDGKVDAEPLYLSGLMVNGTAHNVVFVETENDSVYAFDSDTGVTLWQDTVAESASLRRDHQRYARLRPGQSRRSASPPLR